MLATELKLGGNIIQEEEAGTGMRNAANSSSVDHIPITTCQKSPCHMITTHNSGTKGLKTEES